MPAMLPGSQFTHFEYNPNIAANAVVIALFCAQFLAQIAQGIYYKTWGFMFTVLAGLLLEIIGYTSRIFMHVNPSSRQAFLINNITLILGPACIAASIYLCMGHLVRIYGEGLSILKPRTLFVVFVLCDLLNLILQGIGGGVSSTEKTPSGIQAGIDIVVSGLATQVTSLFLFMLCGSHFALQIFKYPERRAEEYRSIRESLRFRGFLVGISLATICIFVRSAFRIAELRQGFMGPLANSEVHFMILECGMVVIATGALTMAHPGRCFQGCWSLPTNHSGGHQSEISYSIYEWQRKGTEVTGEMPHQSIQELKLFVTSTKERF